MTNIIKTKILKIVIEKVEYFGYVFKKISI